MGRKSNPAIRWLFERGSKLDDNSNRYRQTCKRCGEEFEKGRHEVLVNHIQRACQGVSSQERQKFLQDVAETRKPATKRLAMPVGGPTTQPTLSGLEALAEVSGHHGRVSMGEYDIARPVGFAHLDGNDHMMMKRLLPRLESSEHYYEHSRGLDQYHSPRPTSSAQASTLTSSDPLDASHLQQAQAALQALDPGLPITSDSLRRSISARLTGDDLVDYDHGEPPTVEPNHSRHVVRGRDTVDDPSPVDDLVDYGQEIEIKAPDRLEHIVVKSDLDEPASDGHAHSRTYDQCPAKPNQMNLVIGHSARYSEDDSRRPASRNSTAYDAIAVQSPQPESHHSVFQNVVCPQENQFQIWSPNSLVPAVPKKVRGSFAPDRRTAVKEVRKMGACLRCRMLKKSCDSDDPCRECNKLENARMWKGQCVRTRPSQIFTVFGSNLYMMLAHKAVDYAKKTSSVYRLPGRLEVAIFKHFDLGVTFPCAVMENIPEKSSNMIIYLEDDKVEGDAAASMDLKFSQYGSQVLAMHFDPQRLNATFPELSRFMHETLRVAIVMNTRTLIARALDLWMCVNMLVVPHTSLTAFHKTSSSPTNEAVELAYDLSQRKEDLTLIHQQLRRKLERACDTHFKSIMTELEKSLVQRKHAETFETFIGTIILLRSIEIVCYAYSRWDYPISPSAAAAIHKSHHSPAESGSDGTDTWPLENPPSYYWQQGEQFSDLMCSMLRLRKVLPDIEVRQGKITCRTAGSSATSKDVRGWLAAAELDVDAISRARQRPYDEVDESQWELRCIGKLFEV